MAAKAYTHLLLKLCTFIILCIFYVILQNDSAVAMENSSKRVLFISSYTESYEAVPQEINGIEKIFTPLGISLDIEYMDTKRLDTAQNITLFYFLLKYKLNHVEPYDAIIVGDDNALQFAMNFQNELFSGLPIIFLGINDIHRAETAGEDPNITGIIEKISIKENIELALKFNPEA
ncbi:MAG: diguanylate cyclase, partial [Herbinix sp.]|nr:diguanylate cyclase [Herbinix sp.]